MSSFSPNYCAPLASPIPMAVALVQGAIDFRPRPTAVSVNVKFYDPSSKPFSLQCHYGMASMIFYVLRRSTLTRFYTPTPDEASTILEPIKFAFDEYINCDAADPTACYDFLCDLHSHILNPSVYAFTGLDLHMTALCNSSQEDSVTKNGALASGIFELTHPDEVYGLHRLFASAELVPAMAYLHELLMGNSPPRP